MVQICSLLPAGVSRRRAAQVNRARFVHKEVKPTYGYASLLLPLYRARPAGVVHNPDLLLRRCLTAPLPFPPRGCRADFPMRKIERPTSLF